MAYHIRYYTFLWIIFCHICDGKNNFTNYYNKNEDLTVFSPLTESTRKFFKEVFSDNFEDSNCYKSMTDNITIIRNIFEYSGEDISDLGNEIECENLNLKYYIFIYSFTNFTSESEVFNNTEKNEIFNLVGNDSFFYTGVCLPPSCDEIFSGISMNNRTIEQNSSFYLYLKETMNINDIQYVSKNTKIKRQFSPTNVAFLTVSIILLIYFIFQCLSTIILEFFLKSSNEKQESPENKDKKDEPKRKKSIRKRTLTKSQPSTGDKINSVDLLFNSTYYNLSLYIQAERYNKSIFYKIVNFLSFTTTISKLSDTKNNIYNEKNLKMLSLIKTILLFLIVYNHNFFTQHKYPGRGFFNVNFYSSYFFSTVKFTTFSSDCFIALEAFSMIYKLMNYIKTHYFEKGEKLSWVLFKFWLLFIPKMILFFANFYLLHYFVHNFSSLFDIGAFHQYYLRTIAHKKSCERNQYQLFIPFYLSYCADESDNDSMKFTSCFRFVYAYLNMFYIFTLFLIIFYAMYKIKSKIIDTIIALLVVLGTILTFLSFYIVHQPDEEKYNLYTILGQGLTIKFPHLLINTYMFGVFTGLIYFYFLDVISNRPITSEDTYIPFSFCFGIMKFFDSLSMLIKILIIIISIILQIILSMTYNFYRSYYQKGENTILSFTVTTFMKIFDQYDKQIFTLIFLTMTIFFMLLSKETVLRNLTSFKIFTFISRNSFSIFSSMDYVIYIIYMVLNIQNALTYKNLVFNSIGDFVIIIIVSGLVTAIFEIPFKTLLKYLLNKDTSEDINNQLNNSLLTMSKIEDD